MEFKLFEQIAVFVLLAGAAGYFVYEIIRRVKIAMAAEPDSRHEPMAKRIQRFIVEVVLQFKVIKDRPVAGIFHALVFWGFLSYIIVTINHFLAPYGFTFLHGALGEKYIDLVKVFSILVLVGMVALAIRRFVFTPSYFEKGKVSYTSAFVAFLIITLMTTFLLEPFVAESSFARLNWWIHALSIMAFMVVVPHSKHFHLVIGPFDLVYKRDKFGYLPGLNIEELDEDSVLGVGTPQDLSREMRFDTLSCVECGRCTERCPANGSDKILDPRAIVHNYEKALLNGDKETVFESGLISSEAIWQCVTCGSCEDVCPLGVEHLPFIQQMRRNLTLEQGDIPQQMQNAFKALQIKQNVWNVDNSDRARYMEELQIPEYEKGKVLLWSSCFFLTEEFRPSTKKLVDLLAKAGVEVGISPLEICCGDPGRKCGGEDVFQEAAMENIAWMKEAGVTKIISACPHCLQTIKDGYQQVDPEFDVEVVHHSQILSELLAAGKLQVKEDNGSVTVHDPCYVSRWGFGDMAGIRSVAGGEIKEPARSGKNSFCCGSGGGAHHFFEDEDMKRIDTVRVEQLLATGAETVATACPFCYNMVTEGLKMKEDSHVKVHDLVDFLE
jgi:Fe-S oxidoreductase